MENKSKLLNDLKIDRNEDEPDGVSVGITVVLVIVALLLGGTGTYFYLGGMPDPETGRVTEKPANDKAKAPIAGAERTAADQAAVQPASRTVPVSDRLLNASGYITARRIATVSAEIMGLLKDVYVEEGMSVKEGDVLARMDSAVASVNLEFAEAQIEVQQAQLESTVANLDEAKRVLERVTELKENDFSSNADVTRAQANVASLEAQLESARASIKVSRLEASRQQERLNDHTIRAPFGGVVTVKNAQPGEIVAPSSAGGGFTRTGICTIVDMDSLEIEVDVNEAFIGRVFNGQKVEANLDAYPSWTIPASVIAIIPTADRAKATVRVRIRIEEKDARILPDMGVKVAFLKS